ncbi:unnamed protein product (macronuclear) [Paramecium tetraurelia]|uniref:Uncharacterized protein n=1 Tax=Paramecium tetraurelia TaxID=5888 RepID=A0C1S9_PARTE|nr:uncharacterized protein GSPATT00034223001 [Paramecium tetraurelia]CAK64746.1 unnamed protein product [Paramecium tetraurelia]|eukprot:XP_001432143.1 hypothetical protein (macronuclear) [Paramecium tetraurelia strain d4-2]
MQKMKTGMNGSDKDKCKLYNPQQQTNTQKAQEVFQQAVQNSRNNQQK